MTILIGYVPTREGWPVFRAGIKEAAWRKTSITVLNVAVYNDYAADTFADEKDLDRVRTQLAEAGLTYSVEQVMEATDVADEILAAAQKLQAELIVVGLRFRTPLAAALVGGTTRDVILGARCPVLTVHPEAKV